MASRFIKKFSQLDDKGAFKLKPGYILDPKRRQALQESSPYNILEVDFSDSELDQVPQVIQLIDIIYYDRKMEMKDWLRRGSLIEIRLHFMTPFQRSVDGKHNLNYWLRSFHYAARFNRLWILEDMIRKGVEIFTQDGLDKTVLHYAAEFNYTNMLKTLAPKVIHLINLKDMFGMSPLLWTCRNNRPANVVNCKFLISLGADAHCVQMNGYTALMLAVKSGSEEIVQELLLQKVDTNAQDTDQWTALHHCAYHGFDVIAGLIFMCGAEIDAKNKDGATPLMIACQNNRSNMVSELISRDANINETDNNGFTPLMLAASKGHVFITNLLLDTKLVDIGAVQIDGFDAMMLATQNKRHDVVQILIDRMNSVTETKDNRFGNHSLIVAAQVGNYQAVTAILKNEKAVDKANMEGQTPLLYAAETGDLKTVRRLIEKGADKEYRHTVTNWTALMIASWLGHSDVVRELISFGAKGNAKETSNLTALHLAAFNGHELVVTALLRDKSLEVNERDEFGFTPLHLAVQQGHMQVCELLLKASAEPGIWEKKGEYLPLHIAVLNNDIPLIGLLIKSGAKVNAPQRNGYTPVMLAIKADNEPLVKFLVEKQKADLRLSDNRGATVLMLAVEHDAIHCFKYLLNVAAKRSVPIDAVDKTNGWNALMTAVFFDKTEMVKDILDLRKVPPNNQDLKGRTALFIASGIGNAEVMKLLVDNSADASIAANDGQTCLGVLVGKRNAKAVEVLLSSGQDIFNTPDPDSLDQVPLTMAILAKDDVMVKALLEKDGLDLDAGDRKGNTPLLHAVKLDEYETAETLLKLGANPNITNNISKSPMHLACRKADTKAIKLLADNGAVFAPDDNGLTPLHILVRPILDSDGGDISDLETRVENCIRIIARSFNSSKSPPEQRGRLVNANFLNYPDSNGNTILHLLVRSKHPSMRLIGAATELGASATIKNKKGQTVLESVYSVWKLIASLGKLIDSKWRIIFKFLLKDGKVSDEEIQDEITAIESINLLSSSDEAEMMVERWISHSQDKTDGASLGLAELCDICDQFEITEVRQVVNSLTQGRKPVFRESILDTVSSALNKELEE